MSEKRIALILVFAGFLMLGFFSAQPVIAAPYSFSLDHFELTGNGLGTVSDDFNDNAIDTTLWEVYDPTVVESGSTVTFQNPGTTADTQLGSLQITTQESYLHAKLNLYDGNGDYQATATWDPIMPGINQFYVMNLSSVDPASDPDENVVIGVANFDANLSPYFGTPAGPMVFFGRAEGDAIDIQGRSITDDAISGDILLRLAFNDGTNAFSGSFSLDGGNNFIAPFTEVTSTGKLLSPYAELTIGSEDWDVQPAPIPSSLLLLLSGFLGIGIKRRIRKG